MSESWRAPRGPLPSVVSVYRCPVCGFRAEWPRIEEHVMDAHPTWGGKREGAGRKAAGGAPRRPVTVWLSEEEAGVLRDLGHGNASAGVRRLLEVGQAASAMDAAFSEFGNEPAYIHEAAAWLHRALHRE